MTKPKDSTTRSFGRTMKAIAWSFTGLRRKRDFDDDVEGGMNPFHVLAAALIGAALFIGVLVAFARYAVA
ncbi:DUF2970 domain-containing protein [Massilia sp. GCM10020059]|uniref:DUF2970 domain-containing protein n=1 Tax=Massilia agrisoli TaxID=2892444 RepID=A0ABS8ITP7_9BURK|nr:DUF2970 domain-containing protein [Massilia agrisoli]MCC6071979.1 DUF2970 domain-containing protein [Massilia agrisoli]